MVERVPCCAWTSNGFALTMLKVPHYWLIENQSWFTNKLRNAMVLTYDFWIYSEVIRRDRAPFFPIYNFPIQKKKKKGKCSRLDPAYSWNTQLAHTPFPKKINTPSTTLRFIRFVAKISVLNPKLPADGQWPKETKESVTSFICFSLIDRTNKMEQSSFCITSPPLFWIDFFLLISLL